MAKNDIEILVQEMLASRSIARNSLHYDKMYEQFKVELMANRCLACERPKPLCICGNKAHFGSSGRPTTPFSKPGGNAAPKMYQ